MATLDIFNNDAFSMSSLIQAITDVPFVPTQLGDEGLFTEGSMNTVTGQIERVGNKLQLVPTAPRGGVPQPGQARSLRALIPVNAVHLPQSDFISADEVQGVRAFGTETELQAVQKIVQQRLVQLRANMDLTMEYQRIGALKGAVLDADGSTILNMYTLFGFSQETVFFDLGNASADIRQKCVDLQRKIQDKMGGIPIGNVKVKVSRTFFDKLTGHANVKKAWDLYQQGAWLRSDLTPGVFVHCGIEFKIYHGGTSAGNFIADDLGYAYPDGVPNMFRIIYAPAPFIETVNTNGLPYYVKQKVNDWGTGVNVLSQSNPLTYNAHPEAVVVVSAAAS